MSAAGEHIDRLAAALAAYPRGHSTDDFCRLVVQVRADDLRQLLGDLHAYRKTMELIALTGEQK